MPASAARPLSTTTILCALMTVDSRCATRTTVRDSPSQIRPSNAFCTCGLGFSGKSESEGLPNQAVQRLLHLGL